MNDRKAPAIGRPAEWVGAAAFFLFATVLLTWPIAAHLGDGLADLWDAKLNAWILNWDYHQAFNDPLRLFDANIFHPARLSLAFSENLFGVAVFGFPLYAAGFSTLAAYNTIFLLGMFLSAMAAWALARHVTADARASLLGGLVYAFLPWRMSQIPHVQFQWGAFLPLLLLFLLRYFEKGRFADLALFGACFAWNALANVHYAVFSGAMLAAVLLFERATGPEGAARRVWFALFAAGIAGMVVSPFFLPYRAASRLYGMERSFHEMEFFSGRAVEFLSAGSRNWIYGGLTRRFGHAEGDFFPGLVALALSAVAIRALWRRPGEGGAGAAGLESAAPAQPGHRKWIWLLDLAVVLLLALFAAAILRPGLRIGVLRLSDPGRLIVLASVSGLLRLAIAFPRRSRYRNFGDFARRGPADRRLLLFLLIAAVGVVMALGAHTPFYRFLYQSLGFIFHALRAPARAIVLFHIALAVLSAWGLTLLAGRARPRRRACVLAGAVLLAGIEYRAFPVDVHPVEAQPAPAYRWLAGLARTGGVMEWPLGYFYDFEYEFRSTAHWSPLINGSSGFAPPGYEELRGLVSRAPIPDEVWPVSRNLGAGLLLFHPHDAPAGTLRSCVRALRRGMDLRQVELWKAFGHGEDTDYAFRIPRAGPPDASSSPEERADAARRFADLSIRPGADPFPPLGRVDFPPIGFAVRSGQWAGGWALDDSGVLDVRVGTEAGFAGLAEYGGARTDVEKAFPRIPGSAHAAFRFAIPELAPGPHTLIVTIEARDGGETVIRRPILVIR